MSEIPRLPGGLETTLHIQNAPARIEEARHVAERIVDKGVDLHPAMDHAAIFVDPPYLLAGPLKALGYVAGWDARCYPSPVDGQDYINVPSGLPEGHPVERDGWPRYVAVVHPVDKPAREQMLSQGYGNPFVHHLTWGIIPPERGGMSDFDYAEQLIPFAVDTRETIAGAIQAEPGTLVMAVPDALLQSDRFDERLLQWTEGMRENEFQVEAMQGGGFLLQFFVLTGGRIEVALRSGTNQTFNPKSVHKISEDEISTIQSE